MLPFAVFADYSRLAVSFGLFGFDAKRLDAHPAEQFTQFGADIHQFRQVFFVAPREGVLDNRQRRRLAGRRIDLAADVLSGFLDDHGCFADIGWHGAFPAGSDSFVHIQCSFRPGPLSRQTARNSVVRRARDCTPPALCYIIAKSSSSESLITCPTTPSWTH